jgi:hypothetical protein
LRQRFLRRDLHYILGSGLARMGNRLRFVNFGQWYPILRMIPSDGAMMRARRVHLWEEYIQNRSVVLDLKRIGKMLVAVLGRF